MLAWCNRKTSLTLIGTSLPVLLEARGIAVAKEAGVEDIGPVLDRSLAAPLCFLAAAGGAAETSDIRDPAPLRKNGSPCAPQLFSRGVKRDATAIHIERRQKLGDALVRVQDHLNRRAVAPEECDGCAAPTAV